MNLGTPRPLLERTLGTALVAEGRVCARVALLALAVGPTISILGCACGAPARPCGGPPARCPTVDAGPRVDGGRDAPPVRIDAFLRPDAPPIVGPGLSCGAVGTAGAHCRRGVCATGLNCVEEIIDRTTGERLTLRTAFAMEQGTAPDPVTGFSTVVAIADPADDVPLPIATGSFCTQDCDVGAITDACGVCATCSQTIGAFDLVTTDLLYGPMGGAFGDDTGWCRADCVFDPSVAGATCPGATTATSDDAHTCSPASATCVEGCVSDNECRFSIETTREGFSVTVIDESSTATCNPTTHRCDWTHDGPNSVGEPCDDRTDCTTDFGVCLPGGTCAEHDCGRASDTDPASFVCDSGRGVCLGNGGSATICVAGCTAPEQCNPGSTCVPLDAGGTAGPFTGYCLGICDAHLHDPDGTAGTMTTADDTLIPCRTDERCDEPEATPSTPDPSGTCRPPCTTDADCTGSAGNHCELVAGEAYGFCRWLGQACTAEHLSADCHGGEVCDLLAWDGPAGLCGPACTDGACDAGAICIASRGVCRIPCTIGGTACPTGLACLGSATAGLFCEPVSTP